MYTKPDLSDLNLKDGYNHEVARWNDLRTINSISKQQWLDSIDPLENNVWNYLHIERPELETESEVIYEQYYNWVPLITMLIISFTFTFIFIIYFTNV